MLRLFITLGDRWCGWIQSCLRSSRGSVIVNGSPTSEFQFHRGLKQGDPLSPFLFILIMESLYISVQRVVDAGMFRGISMGPSLHLSHLFYANEAIFMGHWSDSNIDTIVQVLECFYRALGLRINMNKSKLIGISMANVIVDQAAAKIGCATLEAPFSYLESKERVIKGIHGKDGKLGNNVNHSHPSIWLDIIREMEQLKHHSMDLIGFIHKNTGNGADTSFWEDVWRGNGAFKSLYPRIYALETCKNVTVAVKMSHENVGYSFRRITRGGEFSVAYVRRLIDEHWLPEVSTKTHWINFVPIKVNVHA
ncbi:RNA-directed DNA polymerase, eukaryota [Tanacetum coccineum]